MNAIAHMDALDFIEAEWRLATAIGWTELFLAGDTWLGKPPHGGENSRGQAQVPRWTRDWAACGPLISQFRGGLNVGDMGAIAWTKDGSTISIPILSQPAQQIEATIRLALVRAITQQLLCVSDSPNTKE